MSMTNAMETALAGLTFNNDDLANFGDAAGLQASAAAGNEYVSLHDTTLVETNSSQSQDELTYTGYARVAGVRSAAGWDIAGDNVSNAALMQFGEMTAGGPETALDFGLGFATSGVGSLHFIGVLDASLVINNGINPEFAIGALDVTFN